jgi:pantothenate kinase
MLVSNRELDLRMTEQQTNRARIVRKAITSIEEKLGASEVKPTLADLVRLLQIEKELDADEPREIIVRWVETATVNALKER